MVPYARRAHIRAATNIPFRVAMTTVDTSALSAAANALKDVPARAAFIWQFPCCDCPVEALALARVASTLVVVAPGLMLQGWFRNLTRGASVPQRDFLDERRTLHVYMGDLSEGETGFHTRPRPKALGAPRNNADTVFYVPLERVNYTRKLLEAEVEVGAVALMEHPDYPLGTASFAAQALLSLWRGGPGPRPILLQPASSGAAPRHTRLQAAIESCSRAPTLAVRTSVYTKEIMTTEAISAQLCLRPPPEIDFAQVLGCIETIASYCRSCPYALDAYTFRVLFHVLRHACNMAPDLAARVDPLAREIYAVANRGQTRRAQRLALHDLLASVGFAHPVQARSAPAAETASRPSGHVGDIPDRNRRERARRRTERPVTGKTRAKRTRAAIKTGTLYDLLGVPVDADLATIRKAYRESMLRLHPDKNGGDAHPDFYRAVEAREILTNPYRRHLYDFTMGQ